MKLLATVTFNASQLRSHLLPILAISEVEEIVLVADRPPPPDLPKLTAVIPSGVERRLLGRAGSKLARCVQIAARMRPDWIVSYNVMPHGVNALVAARAHRTPTLYHMIGGPDEWRGGGWRSDNAVLGRLPRPVRPLERGLLRVIRGATVVCTMGRSARLDLIDAGVDPGKVVVAPPSVDLERFGPASPGGPRKYDLLTVGDLIPRKRQWDFISMVAELRRKRTKIRAALVGTGPLLEDLKAHAGRLGVADAIDFLGFRADLPDVYRSARIFVLSSRHEGLSVAMIEAMASGLPCIVTDVGDLSDLVREGRNGFLVPVGDVGSLATRAEALLADDAPRAAAAEAAREDAASYAGVPRLTEVYERILRGEHVPERAPA